ncbi:MAG: hypothetical protein JO256_01765 [Alphaproteobacteria bacterium]|nr:hypothetical protein [Alphaproteobacteria bacterium]
MNAKLLTLAALVAGIQPALAAAPTAETFKAVLEKQLLNLKPDGMSERQVLFQQVTAGRPNGGYYPYTATLLVRDYGPGYPANRYFGETCIRRWNGAKFDLVDQGGTWVVQGALTAPISDCKPNPAAGVSATPLSALGGSQAAKGAVAPPPASAGALYIGEYACYGAGGRLMAGMGFVLQANGKYADTEGKRGGSYAYDKAKAAISFQGGFLGGQRGSNVSNRGFALSATVSCEPWR